MLGKDMLCKFKEYGTDAGLFWLRLWTGLGMAYHGKGKVFSFMPKFTEKVAEMGFPFPSFFAWSAGLSEFLGGILLVLGLGTRPSGAAVAATMFVAAFIAHGDDPFRKKELALAYLICAIALVLMGGGKWSLDRVLCRRFCKKD